MTRAQMIFDSNDFKRFIRRLDIIDLAEMFSSVSCKKCICRSFCDTCAGNMSCQEIIKQWLEEDVK